MREFSGTESLRFQRERSSNRGMTPASQAARHSRHSASAELPFGDGHSIFLVSRISVDLSELYQQVILDHNGRPRNRGKLPAANRVAHGDNPSCGDQCSVYLQVDGDRVADISFDGSGCAISQASASLMTPRVKGKSVAEVESMF